MAAVVPFKQKELQKFGGIYITTELQQLQKSGCPPVYGFITRIAIHITKKLISNEGHTRELRG